jgi:HAD superfamily hydrolase (TIGR01509 family)
LGQQEEDSQVNVRIAAVVFDMDGLMLDTEAMIKPCFQQAAADLNCDLDDEFYGTLIGKGTVDCDAALVARFGPALHLDHLKVRVRAMLRARMTATGIPIKPGLTGLLALLKRHRILKAVATSTDAEDAEFTLRTAGLWGHFPVIVTGDQVEQGKPQPDIYLEAAARLGVAPGHCVALEDSSTGVLAASRAGMKAFMVPDGGHAPSPQAQAAASAVFASLHDVTDLMSGWLEGS